MIRPQPSSRKLAEYLTQITPLENEAVFSFARLTAYNHLTHLNKPLLNRQDQQKIAIQLGQFPLALQSC